jgi:hypothetical protein
MLNNLHRGFLSIEDASFNNLGFIKSGPDTLEGLIIFKTSSTSSSLRTIYSRFSIRLCMSLGGVPLQSSIFDCAAKKILNSFAFSISSKIRLSFFTRGGIPSSHDLIPVSCFTVFHQFEPDEFSLINF